MTETTPHDTEDPRSIVNRRRESTGRKPQHAVLVESRHATAVSAPHGVVRERTLPLSYRALSPSASSQWLIDRTGWPSVVDADGVYVVGDAAIELGRIVGDEDRARFPLEEGDLARSPQIAWDALQTILEMLLADVSGNGQDLVAVVPSLDDGRRNFWLHALPDALLGDRYPEIGVVEASSVLLDETPKNGVEWSWWIGEFGTSVALRHDGATTGGWLSSGTQSVYAKARTTIGRTFDQTVVEAAGTPAARSLQIFARDLIERLATFSMQEHRNLWCEPTRPELSLRISASPGLRTHLEGVVARVIEDYGVRHLTTLEVLTTSHALARAIV